MFLILRLLTFAYMSERISIVVPNGTISRLQEKAAKQGHTQSALCRKILLEGIKNDSEKTRELLLETTRNLGHPAYGLSSGTTIAIDELREKAFDFLGVPK